MPLDPGAHVGKYRVIARLGGGGMGEVYRARDTALDRDVALKVIAASTVDDPSATLRFAREAQAASALNHPNIVTVFDSGGCESGPFLVMELVDGQTLRALLPEKLGARGVTDIGRQIARALAVAHAAGIVHRDIKPENVMVRSDGYVKVLDFGLARVAQRDVEPSANTTTVSTGATVLHSGQAVVGTAAYMSPEQARGDEVTGASDVFALGLVLYEIATGRHPFAGGSTLGVVARMLSEMPVPPSRFNPDLPAVVDTLILRMLDKDPRGRPDASEVDCVLARAVEGGESGEAEPRRATAPHTVGHDASRAELVRAFSAAVAGRGSLVALGGEPGIGKTTLAEDFIRHAATAERCVVARGRCSERHAGGGAYLPWLEVLESMRDRTGTVAARLMRGVAPTWYAQVAPLAVDDSPEGRALTVNRAGSQQWMKRELLAFVEEVARQAPLVLFLDDVHWADESTIDLLEYLVARIETMRVMIVVTYRPTELLIARHPFLRLKLDMEGRGVCRDVHVEFLTPADVERFLALEFPGHRFAASFAALVHAKTEGNPLFMVDLVRALRDRGVIRSEGDSWVLAQSAEEFEKEIPPSVRSMIALKLARLDDADRRLLVAASVQGPVFDSAVVARAAGVDQAEVEDRLEAVARLHGLANPVGEAELPDRTLTVRYRFVHVLYQNALYGSLGPSRRAAASAGVARALLAFYGEQTQTIGANLAYLFDSARDFSRAAEYYLRASEHARKVFADREALRLARRGLEMLRAVPDSPERSAREVAHLMAVALPMHGVYGYAAPELEDTFRRARELCDAIGEHPRLFGVISGIGAFHFMRAELRASREAGEQLSRLAEQVGDPAMRIWAHWAQASAWSHLGERLPEALAALDEGAAQYDPSMHPGFMLLTGFDAGLGCRLQAARVAFLLGDADGAVERVDRGVALAQGLGHPLMLAFALFFQAWIRQHRAEPAFALGPAEEAVAIGDQYGYPHVTAWARVLRGWAMAHAGSAAEGEAVARHGLETLEAIGIRLMRPNLLALVGEAQRLQGRIDAALATTREARATAERTQERCYLPQILALERALTA